MSGDAKPSGQVIRQNLGRDFITTSDSPAMVAHLVSSTACSLLSGVLSLLMLGWP